MRTRDSEALAAGLLRSLGRGAYREELHPRDEAGRFAPKAGGPLSAEADRVAALRGAIGEIADEEAADLREQVREHRMRIPTDYSALARRQEARRRRAFDALEEAVGATGAAEPSTPADADVVSRARRYIREEAERSSPRGMSEAPWDEEFDAVMLAAEGVLRRAAREGQ